MEYYILDNDLNVVEGIELFQSMIWTEKFYEAGDFELYLLLKGLSWFTERPVI